MYVQVLETACGFVCTSSEHICVTDLASTHSLLHLQRMQLGRALVCTYVHMYVCTCSRCWSVSLERSPSHTFLSLPSVGWHHRRHWGDALHWSFPAVSVQSGPEELLQHPRQSRPWGEPGEGGASRLLVFCRRGGRCLGLLVLSSGEVGGVCSSQWCPQQDVLCEISFGLCQYFGLSTA